MTIRLRDKLKTLPAQQQEAIAQRAEELIQEEELRQKLKTALDSTQKHLAQLLNTGQQDQEDILLSTLHEYVKTMGAQLHLIVKFPDRPPLQLTRLSELEQASDPDEES